MLLSTSLLHKNSSTNSTMNHKHVINLYTRSQNQNTRWNKICMVNLFYIFYGRLQSLQLHQHQLIRRAPTPNPRPSLVFSGPTEKGLRNPIPKVARLGLPIKKHFYHSIIYCSLSLTCPCHQPVKPSAQGFAHTHHVNTRETQNHESYIFEDHNMKKIY